MLIITSKLVAQGDVTEEGRKQLCSEPLLLDANLDLLHCICAFAELISERLQFVLHCSEPRGDVEMNAEWD